MHTMKIAKETVVVMDYTLRDQAGQVLDSSEGRDPLAYIHGLGHIIPGLEEELEGKSAGEQVSVEVSPEKGYGVRDDSKRMVLPRQSFEGVDQIEVGMTFHAHGQDGSSQVITVVGIEGDQVTVDGNHPLAGQTLFFEVNIVDVRAATAEELSHGHVHGPGGHQG